MPTRAPNEVAELQQGRNRWSRKVLCRRVVKNLVVFVVLSKVVVKNFVALVVLSKAVVKNLVTPVVLCWRGVKNLVALVVLCKVAVKDLVAPAVLCRRGLKNLVAFVVLCRKVVKRIVHMAAQGIQRNCYELQVIKRRRLRQRNWRQEWNIRLCMCLLQAIV